MELDIVLKLQERLSKALEELAEMQAKAISVSTSRLDGLPRATALTSRTENFVMTLADAERRICDLRIEIELKRLALGFEIIERVKGKAQEVLLLHYVEGEPLKKIAEQMKVTPSCVSRWHVLGKKLFAHIWAKENPPRKISEE